MSDPEREDSSAFGRMEDVNTLHARSYTIVTSNIQ